MLPAFLVLAAAASAPRVFAQCETESKYRPATIFYSPATFKNGAQVVGGVIVKRCGDNEGNFTGVNLLSGETWVGDHGRICEDVRASINSNPPVLTPWTHPFQHWVDGEGCHHYSGDYSATLTFQEEEPCPRGQCDVPAKGRCQPPPNCEPRKPGQRERQATSGSTRLTQPCRGSARRSSSHAATTADPRIEVSPAASGGDGGTRTSARSAS